jgi:tetratricopeptide (TPR) repeat protein
MTTADANDKFRRQLRTSARLLQENRPEEALELLHALHKLAPTDPDVAINLGGAYILQRKWNRAVAVLSKAVEAHPQNAMLWTNLGAAYLGNLQLSGPKQQAEAIAAYERVLEIDPQAPNIHYHLGLIYKERGELQQALIYFQHAYTLQPLDRDAQYWTQRLRAQLAQQPGNDEAAE